MDGDIEDRRSEITLTGWWVALAVIVLIIGGLTFLTNVVLVDRLTLHNATIDPVVFAGARGQPGNVHQADVYVGPCESADFEWGEIGWTTDRLDAFRQIENAVRLEMTIEPPVDGVAGAHYEAVATTDGINLVEDYEPSPPCAG